MFFWEKMQHDFLSMRGGRGGGVSVDYSITVTTPSLESNNTNTTLILKLSTRLTVN